jgi:hypothetical protein
MISERVETRRKRRAGRRRRCMLLRFQSVGAVNPLCCRITDGFAVSPTFVACEQRMTVRSLGMRLVRLRRNGADRDASSGDLRELCKPQLNLSSLPSSTAVVLVKARRIVLIIIVAIDVVN